MTNDIFYNELFNILTHAKIGCPFKLSLSIFGFPYISKTNYAGTLITSIIRTATAQPSLIHLLSCGYTNPLSVKAVHALGVTIGSYFEEKLNQLTTKKRDETLDILSHNIMMLYKSYGSARQAEGYCIHVMAQCFMKYELYEKLLSTK